MCSCSPPTDLALGCPWWGRCDQSSGELGGGGRLEGCKAGPPLRCGQILLLPKRVSHGTRMELASKREESVRGEVESSHLREMKGFVYSLA